MSATSNCCPSFSSSEYHLNSTFPPEMVDWLAGAVIARSAETGLRLTVATSAETVSREERDESMMRVGLVERRLLDEAGQLRRGGRRVVKDLEGGQTV